MSQYRDNFERIFGSEEDRRARDNSGRTRYSHGQSGDNTTNTTIIREIEPFKSPIDGSVIETRQQRDAMFKAHGVTDASDYSPEYNAQRRRERDDRLTGNTREARQERVDIIKRAMGYD